MGSVNTWHTFQYCLDSLRYFMPMSGNMGDGRWIDGVVRASDWTDEGMVNEYGRTFHLADSEGEGSLSYRLYPGGTHGAEASNQYTFNGLLWFWNP